MGIYYGDAVGVRLVRQIHEDAEYAEDYEILWEYEGPYWRELAIAKQNELSDVDAIVQTKHETMSNDSQKRYTWLTVVNLLES